MTKIIETIEKGLSSVKHKPKVLLADQDIENLLVLASLLDNLDIDVYKSTKGSDALKQIINNNFALIILNSQLPEMSGLEVGHYLQSFENTKNIPLFFISKESISDDCKTRSQTFKSAECFVHPIDERLLLSKVDNIVQRFNPQNIDFEQNAMIDLGRYNEPVMRIEGDQIHYMNTSAKQMVNKLSCAKNMSLLSRMFQSMPEKLEQLQTFIKNNTTINQSNCEVLDLSFDVQVNDSQICYVYRVIPCYKTEGSAEITLMFHDISDLKNELNKLGFQAFHDRLTGCLNRRALEHNFEQATARQIRNDSNLSVMLIDLDNFKKINDSAGHDAGDFVLKMAADRIKDCLRDVDSLYRLGGDEFCIVIEDSEPLETLKIPAHRIIDAISEGFIFNQNIFYTGASIGITSTLINREVNTKQMISDADKAMYQAKKQGKNKFVFYQQNPKPSELKQTA